ncbi:MAG: phytoene/squalene synthase family protein [Bacteroidia bacterium]|nr:phytoene/squalene synthase family protein [Bacteroidia bacterium]
MQLYKQTCLDCSKVITQNYSTSFTLGIKTLHKKFHFPIYAIYGFVRYADEIVDTFHGFDKKLLLDKFRTDTYEAIESGISLNPVLHSFQSVVNEYNIDHELIDAFLYSMEMDLQKKEYSQDLYETYIYGSAEVVGLMCLYVFCGGDQAEYDRLKAPAQSLGKAFQKVNFLRDMKSDHEERGRVYFPGVDFHEFNLEEKIKIETDIQADFDHAYTGIVELPEGARRGVYLAYRYYLKLFHKITKLPPARILKERIRVPDKQKLLILLRTYLERQMKPAPQALS